MDDHTILIPAGGYRQTEANLKAGSPVQKVLGAKGEVLGGKALGFRLTGTAEIQSGTDLHERVKARFPWCRGALVMKVTKVEKIQG
jgi:hypothetical protein